MITAAIERVSRAAARLRYRANPKVTFPLNQNSSSRRRELVSLGAAAQGGVRRTWKVLLGRLQRP